MKTHYNTCIYLEIEPKVDLVDSCCYNRYKSDSILQKNITPNLSSNKDSTSSESNNNSIVSTVIENKENISLKINIANSAKPSVSFAKFDALVKHIYNEHDEIDKTGKASLKQIVIDSQNKCISLCIEHIEKENQFLHLKTQKLSSE